MYRQARQAAADHIEKSYPQSEIITEEVIGYTPLLLHHTDIDQPPMLEFTRCSSEDDQQRTENSPPINRSSSWNEMANTIHMHSDSAASLHYSQSQSAIHSTSRSEPRLESLSKDSQATNKFLTVQYSQSYPSVVHQYSHEENMNPSQSPLGPGSGDVDMALPDFLDENIKSKLYPRRGSRTEKRYHTADAIQEMQKNENRDNSIYKRLSWNIPNGDISAEKQGVLRNKVMSTDSIRSIHSSSGVSSTGSLHLSPEDVCEENQLEDDIIDFEDNEMEKKSQELNENDVKDQLFTDNRQSKSRSTSDIVSLMQELNTSDIKDGISSVDLPILPTDPNLKLSHAQLLRMKKQLLLSSTNIEARYEVIIALLTAKLKKKKKRRNKQPSVGQCLRELDSLSHCILNDH